MPGGDMLLVADYVRERSDFILVGPEGQIVRADGTSEVLEAGLPIYQGDTLVTADGSTAGVIFADKTTLSIGEDARMVIDKMVYDPVAQEDS